MTYDKQYYDNKKKEQIAKFQKAQQKWIQMCEMAGKEYMDFMLIAGEVQQKVREIEAQEKESQAEETKTSPKKGKTAEPAK